MSKSNIFHIIKNATGHHIYKIHNMIIALKVDLLNVKGRREEESSDKQSKMTSSFSSIQ